MTGDEPYFYGGIGYSGFQNVREDVGEPSIKVLDPLRRDTSEFRRRAKCYGLVREWIVADGSFRRS